MIIWIASYPKSGNTWVRSFLTNYFSGSSEFNFGQLDKIQRFPRKELYDQLKINYHNLSEIISNWIYMQEFINLKNEFTYLKTHNAMCTVNNHPFTNKKNTAGFIYLVRDPRDVILSYSKHLNLDLNETFEIGVSLGGTNFQKLFSSTLWCVNSISSALAKPSTWLIMPCIPSVNNIPFNLDINYYIDFV